MSSGRSEWRKVLCASFVAQACATVALAAGVLARPAHIYVTADAGSVVLEKIALSTTGDAASVVATPSFFTMDDRGRPQSCPSKTDARSLVGWMSINIDRAVLMPGQSEAVDIQLAVPLAAEGSYWGALLLDIQDVGSKHGMSLQPRIAIPLVVTVRGTDLPRVRIDRLTAFRRSADEVTVSGEIVNRGNVVLRSALAVAIEEGSVAAPIEVAACDDVIVFVLPDGRRAFTTTLHGRFAKSESLRASVWIRFASGATGVAEASCEVLEGEPCMSVECRRS